MFKTTGLILIFATLIGFHTRSLAQLFPGCPSVDIQSTPDDCAGTILSANAFPVGSTESYTVTSIPHQPPVAYNEPGGTAISVGTDDVWSPVITLPFAFCFMGNTYTQAMVGSNGAIKMGTTTAIEHPWMFDAPAPSPALVDAGNIFGPYNDIDPSLGGTVKWYLLGAAPCRILVVVFNNVPQFDDFYCYGKSSTFMMVLYETTNVIDVYIQRKDLCTSWNEGNAVIAIQNNAGTLGYAAPGRNTGTWSVSPGTPEAWRFQPNGSTVSYTVEWLQGGSVIGTGNTINVNPSAATTYTARATYTTCTGLEVVVEDQMSVSPGNPNALQVGETHTNVSCHGAADGQITLSASNGQAPYTFSFNNGPFQSEHVFSNLGPGTYTITVHSNDGCEVDVSTQITEPEVLGVQGNVNNISCSGANNGSISLTATGGTTPYSYSMDASNPQASPNFTNLGPGNHSIVVTDANGCEASASYTVTQPPAIVNPPVVANICQGQSYTFQGQNYNISGTYNHNLQTAAGCDSVLTLELTVTPAYLETFPVSICDEDDYTFQGQTFTSSGVYTFTYPTANGCDSIIVLDLKIGTTSHQTIEEKICEGESYVFYGDTLTQGGIYTMNMLSPAGCDSTITLDLKKYPRPEVSIEEEAFGRYCAGERVQLTASGADSYRWWSEKLSFLGTGNPISVELEKDHHRYYADGYNAYDCYTRKEITLYLEDCSAIFIPSAFTPNDDGINDVFRPFITDYDFAKYEFCVWDRWGNMIFYSTDPDEYWLGNIHGGEHYATTGVYSWQLSVKSTVQDIEPRVYQGHVTLIR